MCGDTVDLPISLCKHCESDLPRLQRACKQCGIPLNIEDQNVSVCGQCLKYPPAFDYTLSLFHYEAPIDYLIGQLKFQQQLSFAAILGELLKTRILNADLEYGFPGALIPVPLHNKRLIKRGFNQVLEITRATAKEKGIPLLLDTVIRIKDTETQTTLSKKARQKNVKDCFQMVAEPGYSHVVIIDDVITTGATTNELATLLKKSGVEKVGVWSIARADINQT